MNNKKKRTTIQFVLLSISIIFSSGLLYSQVVSSGRPVYNPCDDTVKVAEIIINTDFKNPALHNTDSLFKNDIFAIPVDVNINPEMYGNWISIPQLNKKVWLLKIKAPGAQSLNLLLNPFNLLQGTKLFFYDSLQSHVIGAITWLNNKPSDILPISIINGDIVYCEIQMPAYAEEYGSINISQIGVEPQPVNKEKSTTDKWFNQSEPCHVNVNCIKEASVMMQKNAVCRIIYKTGSRCTGTLLNNLNNDGTPYVLTAAHCINTDFVASTAVFYFNYESPTCENIDGPINSISGATLVSAGYHNPAMKDTLDFALLKLSEMPPIGYLPFYSGWDATGSVPDSTFVIHHPMGDIKKISKDSDSPLLGNLAGPGFDENTHWLVVDYNYGSSEVGSSGSGLIDNKNRLIGTLSAGGEVCSSLIYDYYQKLAHSFNDYSDSSYQLKYWLDPNKTGRLTCNAFDFVGAYRETAQKIKNSNSDSTWNAVKQTKGWGYVSGHNYQNNSLFAEHLTINGSKYLYGAYIYPCVSYSNSQSQQIRFFLCKGGSTPGEIIYEKTVPLNIIDTGFKYYIDFDSTLLVDYDFYFGYEIGYNSDTFAVYTSAAGSTENTAFTYLNNCWKPLQLDGEEYYSHLAVEVLAFDMMPKKGVVPDTVSWNEITLYPNPANETVHIYFKNYIDGNISCSLYDICGRLVEKIEYTSPGSTIPLPVNIVSGLYLLQIKVNEEKTKLFKLIIAK